MLVVFPPIFVVDTIIINGYNFVVPLTFTSARQCVPLLAPLLIIQAISYESLPN